MKIQQYKLRLILKCEISCEIYKYIIRLHANYYHHLTSFGVCYCILNYVLKKKNM